MSQGNLKLGRLFFFVGNFICSRLPCEVTGSSIDVSQIVLRCFKIVINDLRARFFNKKRTLNFNINSVPFLGSLHIEITS